MLWAKIRSLSRCLFQRSRMEREVAEELQFHLEARTNDLIAKDGLSPDNARRQARLEFGSTEGYKEEARQALGLHLIDELRADLKFALRMLNRNRGLACTAIFSLALGIGANTVYGLAAYTVAQRAREIGIRVAIGAQSANILRLIFGRTTFLVAVGSVAGITLGALSSQLLARFIVGVSPRDPVVLAGATLSMLLIAIAAAWRPLRRALTVDPVQALRSE